MAGTLNTPDVLTQPIANNGTKNSIPNTNDQSLGLMSQSTGFPAICSERIADGGKAPKRADFNGAFNLLSQQHFFLQNGGQYTFRQDVSDAIGGYPQGAMLFYTDSNNNVKIVRSKKQNNTANFVTTPSYIDDGTNWETVVPTVSWCNSTFVNLSGSQTITGYKIFSGGMVWSDPNHAKGTYVSDTWASAYPLFADKNGTRIGFIQPMFLAGTNKMRLAIRAEGDTAAGINIDSDGNTYAPTPSTTTETNHNKIATTGWVNTVGNGVVHTTGNETVNGQKVFTDTVFVKNTSSRAITKQDSNSVSIGTLEFTDNGNDNSAYMFAFDQNGSNGKALQFRYNSGNAYGICPGSDATNSIVTTTGISKTQNGYVKLGNGMIIQWGRVDNVSGNSYSTVNLPTAFTSSAYAVVTSSGAGGSGAAGMMHAYDQTTTQFKLDNSNAAYQDSALWIAVGW